MFGDITVKSRPLRLAFFIPPDKQVLREVIRVNSSLWGGTYNPIIILYKRAPKAWEDYPGQKKSIRKYIEGYIRAFDPDVFVNCGPADLPSYITDMGRPVLKLEDIWAGFYSNEKKISPQQNVGIFELLNSIYKDLFEVKQRFPTKISFPKFPSRYGLFWASMVGELPTGMQEFVEKNYSETLDIEKPDIDEENYGSLLKARNLFPRHIARHRLRQESKGRSRGDAYAFYMNADSLPDIADYWNLRALGRTVVPVPHQFSTSAGYKHFVENYVRSQFRVHRHYPQITYGTVRHQNI